MAAPCKRTKTMNRDVPPELMREIFLHLPCKSLLRFRSACKLVDSFLRDLQFIHKYREGNMKSSHYLTWDSKDGTKLHVFELSKDRYTHMETIPTYRYRFALPSTYGLVCLHGWDTKSIALLNPLSGKLISLPDLPRPFSYKIKNKPHVPIPTSWRNNNLGFGFDPKTKTYKIVQFVIPLSTQAISKCYVLTVNHGEQWRRINVSNKSMVHFLWQPVHVDGVLYWEMDMPCEDEIIRIFIFDLCTEKMSIIQSPARYRSDGFGNGKHLTLLEGKLCCAELTPPVDMLLGMKIWKLNHFNDNVEWIVSYKLDIYDSRPVIYPLFPLYMDDEKRLVCESLGDLYRFDLEKKSLEVYPVSQKIEGVACYPYANLSIIHSETIPTPIDLLC